MPPEIEERTWRKFYLLLALAAGWDESAAAAYADVRVTNWLTLAEAAVWRGSA